MTSGSTAGVRREARIDLGAFARNLRSLLEVDDSFVLDARADAFGHGAQQIVRTALDLGVNTVRVSPNQTNLLGIKRSALMTVAPRRTVVADDAYGLTEATTPVMTLVGEVIAVKPAEAGVGVSYGYSYHTTDATTLALVALGYADGVPRLASNRAEVLVAGGLHPLVGRVAMDQFVVDCGPDAPSVGDEAVLFGASGPTARDWAEHSERSALDLTAGLGSRIVRVYA